MGKNLQTKMILEVMVTKMTLLLRMTKMILILRKRMKVLLQKGTIVATKKTLMVEILMLISSERRKEVLVEVVKRDGLVEGEAEADLGEGEGGPENLDLDQEIECGDQGPDPGSGRGET